MKIKKIAMLAAAFPLYNAADVNAAPLGVNDGYEVKTGVDETITESVASDKRVTYQIRPDFQTATRGSLVIGNDTKTILIRNTNNDINPNNYGAVIAVTETTKPLDINILKNSTISSEGDDIHGLLLGVDNDANASVINIGNSLVEGKINTAQASGIHMSGQIQGILTIGENAVITSDRNAITINGFAKNAELIVKGRLNAGETDYAIDGQDAGQPVRMTVDGGYINGIINLVDNHALLVTVTGNDNYFMRGVFSNYFQLSKGAAAHVYSDFIGDDANGINGALFIGGNLVIESREQVATTGTLILSPDGRIQIKHLQTGANNASIYHDGDIQLRHDTGADFWTDLASKDSNYAVNADPNQANYKYNVYISPQNQQFLEQADVVANILTLENGWDNVMSQVNMTTNILYSLGNPQQDQKTLVVNVHPNSPEELKVIARNGGAGASHQQLIYQYFTSAINNPENILGTTALTTAGQIRNAQQLAQFAAEVAPLNQAQQATQSTQQLFIEQVAGQLSQPAHRGKLHTNLNDDYLLWLKPFVGQTRQDTTLIEQVAGQLSQPAHRGKLHTNLNDDYQLWLKPFAGQVRQDTTHNSSGDRLEGYKTDIKGLSLGLKHRVNERLTFGVAVSTAHAKTNTHHSKDQSKSDIHQLNLYSSWDSGTWFMDTIVNAGLGDNDVNRYLDGFSSTPIQSEFFSFFYGLHLKAGKHISYNQFKISPTIGFNYSSLTTASYSEKDPGQTGTAQEVKRSASQRVEIGAGVIVSHVSQLKYGTLTPSVSLSGWHDLKGQQINTESKFLFNSNYFSTEGIDPVRNYLQVAADIGFKSKSRENINFIAGYQLQRSSDVSTGSAYLKVQYGF